MSSTPIVVIRGDGIGPEIMEATLRLLDALDCGLEYHFAEAGLTALDSGKELLPEETLALIAGHKVALKGPLTTPVGKGFRSLNVALRMHFDLYANMRPAVSFPGTTQRYDDVDVITVRENTEGLYAGKGEKVSEDGQVAESLAVVTRPGCERIVHFAFETARKMDRKKVTAVHKANILKSTSGMFLDVSREIAKDYAEIEFNDLIVDNCCMQLVINPHQFDVIVTTNLFGDIISDLCAGLVGGLGMAPGANIGDGAALFEAVHGSAPDIAGKKIANPSALMLAAALMLGYLGMEDKAQRIRDAIRRTVEDKNSCTPDLGGSLNTDQFADAVLKNL